MRCRAVKSWSRAAGRVWRGLVSNSLNTFVLHQRPLSDVKLGEVFTALIHEVSNGQWLLLLSPLLIERMEEMMRQMRKCSAARAYATEAQRLAICDCYRGDQGLHAFARQVRSVKRVSESYSHSALTPGRRHIHSLHHHFSAYITTSKHHIPI